ncbi:MAG: SIS domain-containing protein [Gemmatimonadota bacterium]|nr:SIS domain-containing protein [Gemmatimonadota bacterium]
MTGVAIETAAYARLVALAERRVEIGAEVATRFFDNSADRVAYVCFEMAQRFERGARLYVFGRGASASDAHHVAVEFVHPVLVGKRALPAIALHGDVSASLATLARADDIAIGISAAPDAAADVALVGARAAGMLAIRISGGTASNEELAFVVPSHDAMLVQEVQETLCHVIWELVHVYLDGSNAQ